MKTLDLKIFKSNCFQELIMDRLRWDERRTNVVLEHLVKEGIAWIDNQSTDTIQYWIPSLFLQQHSLSNSSTSVSDSIASTLY